jgi:hypothetical protein
MTDTELNEALGYTDAPMRPIPTTTPAPRTDWWNLPTAASAWRAA